MILCKLGIHDYKRIGGPVPTKAEGEFNHYVSVGHHALGKCRRCGKHSMRECGGSFSYYPDDMRTKKEWLEILVSEEVNLAKEDQN